MFENDGTPVSELRSAIERYRNDRLSEMPDARIEEDFAELHRAIELLEAERLRRLAEIDRRRVYERDGHLSAASWLSASRRIGWGTARHDVRVARALGNMPQTRRALEDGTISMSAVRVLADAHSAHAEAFMRGERRLVEAARLHTPADLQRVVAFWRERVTAEDATRDGADAKRARRRLHASVTIDGMVRVDGDLDPENGEGLLTALHAVLDTEARSRGDDDTRTPAQRRADALGEVCRHWLEGSDRPVVAGERPHLTVTVPAAALARGAALADGAAQIDGAPQGGPGHDLDARPFEAELDHVGAVDLDTARRLACDASVMRVVMGPRSEPLDVGRRTPVVRQRSDEP